MAIVEIKASKATPEKAIAYVTDENKAGAIRTWRLDPGRDYAEQFRDEAAAWGKPWGHNDRKYYHMKLSFHPSDWVKNGGSLTEEGALDIGMELVVEFFGEHSSVLATHIDTEHMHVHGIINAVALADGSMIDMRNEQYRKFKDRVQEICEKRGLHALDWREATIEARARERQDGVPISESFSELGLRNRGQVVWKDELRAVIDDAATTCTSMEEFTERLLLNEVVITRITGNTISYKLRDHRVCRGDGLGADYTLAAIRHALAHNVGWQDEEEYADLDITIDDAENLGKKRKKISMEERLILRDIGRDAFMSRMEIDDICDFADRATWDEKQVFWKKAQKIKEKFWDDWRARRGSLEDERKKLLSELRRAKKSKWLFDPRNRRKSLFFVVVGLIVFRDLADPEVYRKDLAAVSEQIKALKEVGDKFRAASASATLTLRANGYSTEKYEEALKSLQGAADKLNQPEERKKPMEIDRGFECLISVVNCEHKVRRAQEDYDLALPDQLEAASQVLEEAKANLEEAKASWDAHMEYKRWIREAKDREEREVRRVEQKAEEEARDNRTEDHKAGFGKIFGK